MIPLIWYVLKFCSWIIFLTSTRFSPWSCNMNANSRFPYPMNLRLSSMWFIIIDLKEEVVAMVLHSHLARRKFLHILEKMATSLTLAIGNIVFLHILVKILLWLINLALNWMNKGRMIITLKVVEEMSIMDSLSRSMINLCIYFMHQTQITMLPLAKWIMYLIQITILLQVLVKFHILLIIQILDHG